MILLISDLHLCEERPDLTRAFLHFLHSRAVKAQALYILGDFFEVWIGDDALSALHREIAQALQQLSRGGTQIFLMHGNRDFLIGQDFCRVAGVTLIKDPHCLKLGGERVLLMHGDSLCTRDISYMKLRRWLRNPLSLFILRHLPLATRQKLARNLRQQSKAQTRAKACEIIDVTPEAVAQIMRRYQVRTLIHGHTHRPFIHQFKLDGQNAQRIVLGDWDRQGWALEVGAHDFTQAAFSIDGRPE